MALIEVSATGLISKTTQRLMAERLMNDELERIRKAEVVYPIDELFHLMALSEPMKGNL
jgi:hypothetical protein